MTPPLPAFGHEPTQPDSYWNGARMLWPVAMGDVVNGIAFGALAAAAGLTAGAAVVMSASSFSAGAQLATLTGFVHGEGLLSLVGTACALNIRFLVFGAVITSRMAGARWRRALCCLFMTDASWALAQQHGSPDRVAHRILVGGGLVSLVGWSTGTALGALGASRLGDPEALGLDAVLPALFVWIVLTRQSRSAAVAGAAIGGVVALVMLPVLPAGLVVLLAGGVAAGWGLLR